MESSLPRPFRFLSKPEFWMLSPSVAMLLLWMVVPLSMTIYFSLIRYNLLYPGEHGFTGWLNYEFFYTDEAFWPVMLNTALLVGGVILATVVLGILFALLMLKPFPGRGAARILLISPFFIMPTVNALMWKNMMLNPVYGIFAWLAQNLGLEPVRFLQDHPLASIVAIVAWNWTPFAFLIFATALLSFDKDQKGAAEIDGAGSLEIFRYLYFPHLYRPMAVVIMIQMIFHLSLFAEIFTTTVGGPGFESTNLAFMIFSQALMQYDVGVASAGGLIAVLLANVAAFFLIRLIGDKLMAPQ